MDTNGISLNKQMEETDERKAQKRSLFIGVVAGVALAAALGGAFMLGSRGGGDTAAARTSSAAISGAGSDDNDDAGGAEGIGGASNNGGDEPGGAGEQSGDEATAAPDEPTATPTATPDGGCQFCPEDVDDLAPLPTATPGDPCPFCPEGLDLQAEPPVVPPCGEDCVIDGGFNIELPDLAFEETFVKFCDGFIAMKAQIQGNAEIWAEYTKDGDAMESAHTFGGSMLEGETATWTWFGGWGWLYPWDFVFHAEDAEGNHIEKAVAGDYVC